MKKSVDAILLGDIHLRLTQPLARKDDFAAAQWKKLDAVKSLQEKHNCPVICSGDLFDNWKPSPELIAKAIEHLPAQFYTVYGNHDLPQHNFELNYKSGIYVLEKAAALTVLSGTHWEQEDNIYIKFPFHGTPTKTILVKHVGTYKVKAPYPGCPDKPGRALIRKHPVDLILTGHNHIPFTEKLGDRLLVNPGCITRQEADQKEYKPAVWLWNAEENTVEPYYLPIDKDVISDEHIVQKNARNKRLEAFISSVDTDFEGWLTFDDNIERFFAENNTKKEVKEIINSLIH